MPAKTARTAKAPKTAKTAKAAKRGVAATAIPVVSIRKRTPPAPPLPRPRPEPRIGASESVLEKVAERKRTMLFFLASTKGNVALAVKKTGISRMTHYRWLREDPHYASTSDDIQENLIDDMESLFLRTTVKEKDLRSMRWFLERRAKHRGYGKPGVNDAAAFNGDGSHGGLSAANFGTIINIRSDVPGDAVATALVDVLRANPKLAGSLGIPAAIVAPAANNNNNNKARDGGAVVDAEFSEEEGYGIPDSPPPGFDAHERDDEDEDEDAWDDDDGEEDE